MNVIPLPLRKWIVERALKGTTYTLNDETLGKWMGGGTSAAGVTVSDDTAMRLSAAWSCVRILCETIGSLPWAVFKSDADGNAQRDDDHPLARTLIQMPNADMTGVEFREACLLSLCQAGNAYAYIERSPNGALSSVYPIPHHLVTLKKDEQGTVYYEVYERGVLVRYARERIWHIKGFGNGLTGLSPLGAAREALGTAMATEQFGAKFFSQGGMPSGVITVDKFFTKEQRDIARENLQQMMSGLGNAHKFVLFEGGMKPEPWGAMPLEDMQFLLLRKFSIQEICRFYRIPPHMVADLDKATFSNIEQQSLDFVMFTLMPYFTRFEASATKWLFKVADRRKFFLRFNYEGLLRADSTARAQFYNQMLQNGVYTRNEVRAKENLPRSNALNMDSFTVQLNMSPIEKLGEEKPQPAPTQPALDEPSLKPNADDTAKAMHTNVSVTMPESMKHHLVQRVEVPGVLKLASAVQESAERMSLSNAAVIANVMKLTDEVSENIEQLKEMLLADREIVYKDGEPVGTRLVVRDAH